MMSQQITLPEALQAQLQQLEETFKRERRDLSAAFNREVYNMTESNEDFLKRYERSLETLHDQHDERIRSAYAAANVPLLEYWEKSLDARGAMYTEFRDLDATPEHQERATIRKEDNTLVLNIQTTVLFPDTPWGRKDLAVHIRYNRLSLNNWEAQTKEEEKEPALTTVQS